MSKPSIYEASTMTLAMEGDGVEVRHTSAGDGMSLLYVKSPKGFDFGPALKGLPHDMCCCEHWGMITKGRMDITTHDGQSASLSEGQAFHLLPGHLPAFPEDCEWYEFTPTDQLQRLLTHMGLA